MTTLAIANQKGGVGKTTTAINLGAALAALEQRVLVVDCDPQGNATRGMGADSDEPTLFDVLLEGCPMDEAVRSTDLPCLEIVPSDRDLVGVEVELSRVGGRPRELRDALGPIRERYDTILLDCPPSLGHLTVNALVAADEVLVPLQCEYFALEGISELVSTVDRVRSSLSPGLAIGGILLTMYDERTNLARDVADEIRRHFADKVYETVVPRNVRLAEAPSHGQPILLYDIKSRGAEAYLALAREILGSAA